MLLGDRLTGAYSDWRVVEDDLYHVAARVREYDDEARLVRQDGSGLVGIARWHAHLGKRRLAFARVVVDMTTDVPLTGCPDARVITFMRSTDVQRIRSLRDWQRRTEAAYWDSEDREDQRAYEDNYEHAERYVHALRHDLSRKPSAFIADRRKKAA